MKKDKNITKESEKESGEPLLTITTIPQKPVVKPVEKKESVFAQKPISPAVSAENKPVERKVIIPEPVIVEQPIEVLDMVYKITFIYNELETTVFTYSIPTILETNELKIEFAFGQKDLKENILGQQEISVSCKDDSVESEYCIDLSEGVLIKTLEEEVWMGRDLEETENAFNKAVLEAYRKASPVITKVIKQPIEKTSVTRQSSNQQVENYGEGNIPVNRGLLIKDF